MTGPCSVVIARSGQSKLRPELWPEQAVARASCGQWPGCGVGIESPTPVLGHAYARAYAPGSGMEETSKRVYTAYIGVHTPT